MNIEGWLCRHAVTSSVTSSSWKIFSRIICTWSFHFWYLIGAILNRYFFCKVTKFWGRGEFFRQNCHRKYVISTGKPMTLPTFWAIDRTCSSKIDGVLSHAAHAAQSYVYAVIRLYILPYPNLTQHEKKSYKTLLDATAVKHIWRRYDKQGCLALCTKWTSDQLSLSYYTLHIYYTSVHDA